MPLGAWELPSMTFTGLSLGSILLRDISLTAVSDREPIGGRVQGTAGQSLDVQVRVHRAFIDVIKD